MKVKYNNKGLFINDEFYKFTDIEKQHGKIESELQQKYKEKVV